jgi:hypothetical protein
LAIIAALLTAAAAQGATVTSRDFKDGKVRLDLSGEIQEGDLQAIKSAIQSANDRGKIVATIRLNSIGGNLLEAVKIASVIRDGKIATATLGGTTCASACFVVFAAGGDKYAHYTAQVGVHGASDAQGDETTQAQAATVTMARVVRELGVPPAIIGKMVVTPPSEMVWLTPDDLKSMGVTMLGKPEQIVSGPTQIHPTLQLGPEPVPTAKASTAPTWTAVIETAIAASRAQNNGQIRSSRACQPELRVCSTAIFYKTKNGTDAMVRTAEDSDGKIFSRDLCSFNEFGDVRTCLNWDGGKLTKEMKGTDGKWVYIK